MADPPLLRRPSPYQPSPSSESVDHQDGAASPMDGTEDAALLDLDGAPRRPLPQPSSAGEYSAFLMLGLAMLLPWNVWITATDFFSRRFVGTFLAGTFESWFGLASMLVNLLGAFASFAIAQKYTTHAQITTSLLSLSSIFLFVTLISLTPLSGPLFAFVGVFAVLASSAAAAVLQAGTFALVTGYGPVTAQAIMNGQGVAGAVPAIAQVWIAVATARRGTPQLFGRADADMGKDPDYLHFLLATVLTAAALALYLVSLRGLTPAEAVRDVLSLFNRDRNGYQTLPTNGDVQPLERGMGGDGAVEVVEDHPAQRPVDVKTPVLTAIAAVSSPLVSVFLVFLVTLSVFPAITASVRSELDGKDGMWPRVFVPVGFLAFCLGDWLGRSLPLLQMLRLSSRTHHRLLIFSVLRFLFIPLFLLSNVHLTSSSGALLSPAFPPLIHSDFTFLFLLAALGVTNGWAGSVGIMVGGELAREKGVGEMGGRAMVVGMSTGLVAGTVASFGMRAVACGCWE